MVENENCIKSPKKIRENSRNVIQNQFAEESSYRSNKGLNHVQGVWSEMYTNTKVVQLYRIKWKK